MSNLRRFAVVCVFAVVGLSGAGCGRGLPGTASVTGPQAPTAGPGSAATSGVPSALPRTSTGGTRSASSVAQQPGEVPPTTSGDTGNGTDSGPAGPDSVDAGAEPAGPDRQDADPGQAGADADQQGATPADEDADGSTSPGASGQNGGGQDGEEQDADQQEPNGAQPGTDETDGTSGETGAATPAPATTASTEQTEPAAGNGGLTVNRGPGPHVVNFVASCRHGADPDGNPGPFLQVSWRVVQATSIKITVYRVVNGTPQMDSVFNELDARGILGGPIANCYRGNGAYIYVILAKDGNGGLDTKQFEYVGDA